MAYFMGDKYIWTSLLYLVRHHRDIVRSWTQLWVSWDSIFVNISSLITQPSYVIWKRLAVFSPAAEHHWLSYADTRRTHCARDAVPATFLFRFFAVMFFSLCWKSCATLLQMLMTKDWHWLQIWIRRFASRLYFLNSYAIILYLCQGITK